MSLSRITWVSFSMKGVEYDFNYGKYAPTPPSMFSHADIPSDIESEKRGKKASGMGYGNGSTFNHVVMVIWGCKYQRKFELAFSSFEDELELGSSSFKQKSLPLRLDSPERDNRNHKVI